MRQSVALSVIVVVVCFLSLEWRAAAFHDSQYIEEPHWSFTAKSNDAECLVIESRSKKDGSTYQISCECSASGAEDKDEENKQRGNRYQCVYSSWGSSAYECKMERQDLNLLEMIASELEGNLANSVL